jgi:hypothetical protein
VAPARSSLRQRCATTSFLGQTCLALFCSQQIKGGRAARQRLKGSCLPCRVEGRPGFRSLETDNPWPVCSTCACSRSFLLAVSIYASLTLLTLHILFSFSILFLFSLNEIKFHSVAVPSITIVSYVWPGPRSSFFLQFIIAPLRRICFNPY